MEGIEICLPKSGTECGIEGALPVCEGGKFCPFAFPGKSQAICESCDISCDSCFLKGKHCMACAKGYIMDEAVSNEIQLPPGMIFTCIRDVN